MHTLPVAESRRHRREGTGIFPAPVFLPDAETIQIPGPAGPIPLRVLRPAGPAAGVFLHIHGGGWTFGDHDMQDPRLSQLAAQTGLAVVSVGYRLAPEHPWPACGDDCAAAAVWLITEGRTQLGTSGPLAIGGDSAGAHLAAVTLLRLRDHHAHGGAFAAAVLQYGAFDLSQTPSQRNWGERNLVLSTPIISWFGENLLPGHSPEAKRDPAISPLYADLHELPPAIFSVGTADALLDDSLFMEARWRAAGNAAELHVYPDGPHGFLSLPMRLAAVAARREEAFLRRVLGLPHPA